MSGLKRTFGVAALPLVWCASVLVGAGLSAWLGAPLQLAALLAAVMAIPGLVSFAARGADGTLQRLAGQHEAVLWALGLCAAASVTGGVVSPLCGLLVLLPLLSALEGSRQRSMDAAIAALIGYACLVTVDRFMALPGLPPWAWPLAVFPVVSALVWILGAASLVRQPALPREGTPQRPGPSPRIWRNLDPDGPIAAIDVTPLGRVQAIAGNRRLVPMLKTGQPIDRMVAEPGRSAFARRLARAGDVRLSLPGGRALRVFICPAETGTSLFAVRADAETRAIEAAVRAGEDALRSRNLYYASLSHDLKTPLNAILGFADMMRAEVKGPLPVTYREYADIIHESGEDLMLLVEDILDLAKADADGQSLDIEPVDLAASGRSVMRQMQGQAERRGIALSLSADPDAWAMADARAVRQIWQNLLSNALKYSRTGQSVELSAMRVGQHVELRVDDRGEGMDAADLAAIAAPFAQGKNASGRAGTGLGLTVVKRFADLMGGEVVIESAKGQGTTVRVAFPPADPADYAPLEDAAE